jgi:hypothetical protein
MEVCFFQEEVYSSQPKEEVYSSLPDMAHQLFKACSAVIMGHLLTSAAEGLQDECLGGSQRQLPTSGYISGTGRAAAAAVTN